MSFETSKIIHSDPTYEKPAHILEPISFYTVIFVFQIKKSPCWFSDNHPTRTFGWVSFLSRLSGSPLPTWFARWRINLLRRRPRRCRFDPWVRKMPWRRKWQPTTVFLPREIPWTEEPGRLQSMGSQRVRHNWVTKHTCLYKYIWRGKGENSFFFKLLIVVNYWIWKFNSCVFMLLLQAPLGDSRKKWKRSANPQRSVCLILTSFLWLPKCKAVLF